MEADKTVARMLVLAGTALLAGVCGAVAVYAYFLPAPTPSPDTERIALPVQATPAKQAPKIPAVTLAIAPRKALKPVAGGYAVADGDVVGYATALTSDGWLATDKTVLSGVADPVVLLPDGSVASASGTVADVATGIDFLHVDAKNLGVIAFGDSTGLAPGSTLFRVFPDGRLYPAGLASAHARIRADYRDAIRDSSTPADRLLLSDGIGKDRSGSGIVTDSGALVGVAVAPAKGETESFVAVPIESVALSLREILRSGKATRPSLGLSTVDLSELASRDPALAGSFGATVAAVDPDGPAADAGIAVGDRITALGTDVLDGSRLLSDLLSRYPIGEKVKVTYFHGADQLTADLLVVESTSSPAVAPAPVKK